MGKCADNKAFVAITLDKEVIKTMDGAIKILNKQVDPSKGEKPVTRSQFIENMLKAVFVGALEMQVKVEKQKGGKKDA